MEATRRDPGEIVALYGDMVYRICYVRLHGFCMTAVDDAFQEVFLRYMELSPRFQSEEHEKAWFCRCAVQRCTDILRQNARHPTVELPDTQPVTDTPENTENRVLELLFSLPELYRTPLYLSAVMGYTTGEIASLLHLLPGTARVRLSRAREKMAQLLQETENTKGGSIL